MLNPNVKYPIGIDMGSRNIYAAQLAQTRQGLSVRELFHGEFDAATLEDPGAGGELVSFVKEMSKKRRFRGKSVNLHIPGKNIFVFPIRFQKGKTETLEEAILRESEKHLSFPVEEAAIDYPSLTPVSASGADATYKATVVAAKRIRIELYLNLMKQAGLTVEAVDFPVSSLIRLHSLLTDSITGPTILCNIGKHESLLTAVTPDSILGQYNIPWGVRFLFDNVTANLELVNENDNAKYLLRTYGLAFDDRETAGKSETGDKDTDMTDMHRAIYQIVAPYIDELVHEVHKIVSYARAEGDHPVFDGIFLYGCADSILHLDHYIEKRLGIPTKPINPLETLNLIDDSALSNISEAASFALALGLAMRKATWL